MTQPTDIPEDLPGSKALPEVLAPWAGRAYKGVFDISVEHVLQGSAGWVYGHEATHDSLVKTTPFGEGELFVWALASSLSAPDWCNADLTLLNSASFTVQDGAACYIASLKGGSTPGLPPSYVEAMETFRWISDRLPGISTLIRFGLALTLARRALQTPLLERWIEDELWIPENLAAHLEDPTNHPDHRLATVMLAARELSDIELLEGMNEQFAAGEHAVAWRCGLGDDYPAVASLDAAQFARFASAATEAALSSYDGPAADGRLYASAISQVLADTLAPPHASLIVKSTALSSKWVHRRQDAEILTKSPLLVIHANPFLPELPVWPRADGTPTIIREGQAAVWAHFLDADGMVVVDLDQLRELAPSIPDTSTVCVMSHWYDFRAGDISGGPWLRPRRHVVLIQDPLWALFPTSTDYGSSAGLKDGLVGSTNVGIGYLPHADESPLGYLVLLSKNGATPLVVMPVLAEIAESVATDLSRLGLGVSAIQGPPQEAGLLEHLMDFLRVGQWFAGAPPDVSSLFPDQLKGRAYDLMRGDLNLRRN